ncbi:TetR family transcriptional regulator [Cognatazoarcus halotolerans]|uniref:TetR family transcriptional regulator n=1 Tax=Cognatazoarcus halotolerans TaxID=2686016 RepID=UPI0013569980|nr:TetR family transcriptional regulator [Cognatazoarcus halotolerans]MCB1898647.1 helix-turn-helix transcriptional regulator [Rhodocyclaceae bacterium]MCP5311543.1 helix-turn-helix transcriptional regulator [Zoogloeaceae bacterium]
MNQHTAQGMEDAPDAESAILEFARTEPTLGQAAVAERLRARGIRISPSGVRYIWQRHDLETAVKRLQALADRVPEALTPEQQRLLERGQLSARLASGVVADESEAGNSAGGAAEGDTPSRHALILHVAAERFAAQGYDRTSIRDIARSVGLLPGSVYHHFPAKEDLYLAIHREGFQRVMERVRQAAAEGSDPWDSLRRACEVHVSAMVEGSPVDRITGHSLAMIGDHELYDKITDNRRAYELVFRDIIGGLPLAPDVDRTLLRLTLLGAMNWVAVWYREGKRSPQQIADMMVNMMRGGVEG